MNDVSDRPTEDLETPEALPESEVDRQMDARDGPAVPVAIAGWPARSLGRRATWRFFVRTGGRRS